MVIARAGTSLILKVRYSAIKNKFYAFFILLQGGYSSEFKCIIPYAYVRSIITLFQIEDLQGLNGDVKLVVLSQISSS